MWNEARDLTTPERESQGKQENALDDGVIATIQGTFTSPGNDPMK